MTGWDRFENGLKVTLNWGCISAFSRGVPLGQYLKLYPNMLQLEKLPGTFASLKFVLLLHKCYWRSSDKLA